jgi:hypothetical protein
MFLVERWLGQAIDEELEPVPVMSGREERSGELRMEKRRRWTAVQERAYCEGFLACAVLSACA